MLTYFLFAPCTMENAPPSESSVSGGRVRKSVERYEDPSASSAGKASSGFSAPSGKGCKVGAIDWVAERIDKTKGADPVFKDLHTILYKSSGQKGKVKAHVREWSGFEAANETEMDLKRTKMIEKLMKKDVKSIKAMMDLLDIDRSTKTGSADKEGLVKRMVAWVECPSESATVQGQRKAQGKRVLSGTRKSRAKGKKRRKVQKREEEDDDDDEEEEEEEGVGDSDDEDSDQDDDDGDGEGPSNTELKAWAQNWLKDTNSEEVTVNKAMEACSKHFNCDVSGKKHRVKKYLIAWYQGA